MLIYLSCNCTDGKDEFGLEIRMKKVEIFFSECVKGKLCVREEVDPKKKVNEF